MTADAARPVWLIADDYGLSPGVSRGILALAERRRLSGTGCMTLFEDWPESARLIRQAGLPCAVGIHLTLTDFPAASTGERLPPLKRLIGAPSRGAVGDGFIAGELDRQLDRFTDAIGALPAFVDGHQHVHYLRPVRRWLARRFADIAPEQRPWLRGAPTLAGAHPGIAPKITAAKLLAAGFDRQMRKQGFTIRGPLSGFYDWRAKGLFAGAMEMLLPGVREDGVIMCHPGHADAVLRGRDTLTDAREEELAFLTSADFPALLEKAGLRLAGEGR